MRPASQKSTRSYRSNDNPLDFNRESKVEKTDRADYECSQSYALAPSSYGRPKRYKVGGNYPPQRIDREQMDRKLEEYRRQAQEEVEPKPKPRNQLPVEKKIPLNQPIRQAPRQRQRRQSPQFQKVQQSAQSVNELNAALNSIKLESQQDHSVSSEWLNSSNLLANLNKSVEQGESQSETSVISQISQTNEEGLSYMSSVGNESVVLKQLSRQQEEKQQLKSEEVEKQIEEYGSRAIHQIDISIICRKNVKELRIKQVQLSQLKLQIKLTIDKQTQKIVATSNIPCSNLADYIVFKQISEFIPQIYQQQSRTVTFRFCSARVNQKKRQSRPAPETGFIKRRPKPVQEQIEMQSGCLQVQKVQLCCMSCGQSMEAAIQTQDQSASLSCIKCSEPIEIEIEKLCIA